jgi:DNA-binding beta-propeller fold protein YncE
MKLAALLPLALAGTLLSQAPAPDRTLENGWRLRPAGRQVPLGAMPLSTALSPDGKYLLVLNSGAGEASLSVIDVAAERELSRTPVADAWLGLTFSAHGDRVYVGGGAEAAILEFEFARGKLTPARTFPVVAREKRTAQDFIGDVVFDPAGRMLYAAELFRDSIAVVNPQSGMVIDRIRTGRRPYRILFPPDTQYFLVSSWADGAVYQHDLAKGAVLQRLRVGAHPTGMLWVPGKPAGEREGEFDWVAGRLFVTAANTNNVVALGASAGGELRETDIINVSLTPWQPAGVTPSALALSPDGKRLYIACSDVNAVAVADITAGRAAPLGFIPTGRYPTAVRALANNRIVALNGQDRSASFVDVPDDALGGYSQLVLENMPYRDRLLENAGVGPNSPIPAYPGGATPIRRVIYILTGRCSYDRAMQGANHRKLAREFVSLENFYPIGNGRADGVQWATSGIASDFVVKMQPRLFDYEGGEPAAVPPSAYLWTNVAAARISFRNYGFFVNGAKVKDPTLARFTNLEFRGPDPAYRDSERAKVFLAELAQFEKSGQTPALMLLRFANDQETGAAAADQDAALGMVVEAVAKSKLWADAAIFIAGESADRPGDRGAAFVISPYSRRGAVDRTVCNTASVLRTMELILGLRPMTVFDAGALPLSGAMQSAATLAPYTAAR